MIIYYYPYEYLLIYSAISYLIQLFHWLSIAWLNENRLILDLIMNKQKNFYAMLQNRQRLDLEDI